MTKCCDAAYWRGYSDGLRAREIPPRTAPLAGLIDDSVMVRWWAKVIPTDGCWHWTGNPTPTGYGMLGIKKQMRYAHRIAYEHFNGPIPDGMTIDHICKNPGCVNPQHLRMLSRSENCRQTGGRPSRRLEKCQRGHPMSGWNLIIKADGERGCRACKNASKKRARDRKRGRLLSGLMS